MNKLDELAKRSSGMRCAVRLMKTAITGVCACLLIVSSTRLDFRNITYALDETNDTDQMNTAVPPFFAELPAKKELHSMSVPAYKPQPLNAIQPLDEQSTIKLLSQAADESNRSDEQTKNDVPSEENLPQEDIYVRPGLSKPENYTGNAVTFDKEGNVFIYGTPVTPMLGQTTNITPAEQSPVADDYFDDAVIIGNSLIVGMQKTGIIPATYYANIGLSVRQFFEKTFLPAPDNSASELVTAAEALVRDDSFGKVYLMFGINELGWDNLDSFVSYYETIIDTILTIRPDAIIYVQTILPINESIYRQSGNAFSYCNNARIGQFNEAIAEIAESRHVVLLTPGEMMTDADGQLQADATADGVHLSRPYLEMWKDYLVTHTVPEVDLHIFYESPSA